MKWATDQRFILKKNLILIFKPLSWSHFRLDSKNSKRIGTHRPSQVLNQIFWTCLAQSGSFFRGLGRWLSRSRILFFFKPPSWPYFRSDFKNSKRIVTHRPSQVSDQIFWTCLGHSAPFFKAFLAIYPQKMDFCVFLVQIAVNGSR